MGNQRTYSKEFKEESVQYLLNTVLNKSDLISDFPSSLRESPQIS